MTSSPTQSYVYLAVDVAKGGLEVLTAAPQAVSLPHDEQGLAQLVALAQQEQARTGQVALVVFEPTGGDERTVQAALTNAGLLWACVPAKRIRAHGEALGWRAKTDRIDARKILDYAQHYRPEPTRLPGAEQTELRALMDRRRKLIHYRSCEQMLLDKCTAFERPWIERSIGELQAQIDALESAMDELLAKSSDLAARDQLLRTIKGVGKVASWTILAYMAEIATVSRQRAAALAGLAPYNQDSGQKQAAHISGGRPVVRQGLYMAAIAAVRPNLPSKPSINACAKKANPPKSPSSPS
ncbi:MAG: transposase [Verrucomicrobiota bacterium JB022]|nr:transposase [Verrucomicrobiota bacterium JB022]